MTPNEQTKVNLTISDVIGFRYKGSRFVKGEVVGIYHKRILLKLHTDYIGKNEEWFAGEHKYFNKAEMRKINNLKLS
jgi:hypothetical protein